jgi:hypothetical protein
MSYVDRFKTTDDLLNHLQPIVSIIMDEELKSKYAGFLSANAVTVYELAIKDIFISFAEKKNSVFGMFVTKYFDQINGHIKIDDIRKYVKSFGEKYLNKFNKKLEEKNKVLLSIYHNDIKAIYGNLITCRHKFIHANNTTMTFNEVVEGYSLGKEIIHILNETMQR